MLRPAVEQDDRVRVGRARLGHVHVEPARLDVAVLGAFDLGKRPGHDVRAYRCRVPSRFISYPYLGRTRRRSRL